MQTLLVEEGHHGDGQAGDKLPVFLASAFIFGKWKYPQDSTRCIYSTVEQETSSAYHSDLYQATTLRSRFDWYLSKDLDYKGLIDADKYRVRLDALITAFLSDFIENQEDKPYWIHFTRFIFPGEKYVEPMVVFHFYHEELVDEIMYCDRFLSGFKQFLAKNAEDVEIFKALRIAQQKFRFIVRRG